MTPPEARAINSSPTPSIKKGSFALDPHGCAKNQVDAEYMIAALETEGWVYVEDAAEADLIIVNSCGFIEEAKAESIQAVLDLRANYPEKRIILAGCLAERYLAELSADLAEADGILGNADPNAIVDAANRVIAREGLASERLALKPEIAPLEGLPERRRSLSMPGSRYLKVSEGCDNNCSYCAIPIIRGGLRSRDSGDVAQEARILIEGGVRELVLIGQDLGAYGRDLASGHDLASSHDSINGFESPRAQKAESSKAKSLVDLVRSILSIPGDYWLRLLYIHPDHFPLELLELCASDSRVLPYFDIPFQHASTPILRAMGRIGDAETYLELIAKIRSRLPDATIRSTFLIGFPGETEADFEALLDFQQKARLDWLGSFAYSREEDTRAYDLPNRVAKKTALARKARVESAQEPISFERLDRWVGREVDLLVEERIAGADFALTRGLMNAPEVDGLVVLNSASAQPGQRLKCRIVRRNGVDLEAIEIERD